MLRLRMYFRVSQSMEMEMQPSGSGYQSQASVPLLPAQLYQCQAEILLYDGALESGVMKLHLDNGEAYPCFFTSSQVRREI